MAIEGAMHHESGEVKAVTTVALTGGQVVQTPDGRAAVYNGMNAAEANDSVTLSTKGVRKVQKTITVVMLPGQEVWWKVSTNKATYKIDGDFFVGIATAGATPTATSVQVDMNREPKYLTELWDGKWTSEATDGLGVLGPGADGNAIITMAMDAVAEVSQAALYSDTTIACAHNPIMEAEVAIYDIGDNAALDINIGLANGSHATDFDSVTESCVFHWDGTALSILAESDDGTTEVTATDTTVDAVDDTFLFLQLDARDLTDVKMYVNGVDAGVLTTETMVLSDATGPLKAIVHLEKTSDNTTADVRVRSITLRSQVTG